MSRELYQLVAIDKQGNEQVIGIKNNNKNNKTKLRVIDYGTAHFKNERQLIEYFFSRGIINKKEVRLAVKYQRDGKKYLPVLYDNQELVDIFKDSFTDENGKFLYDIDKIEKCNFDKFISSVFNVIRKNILKEEFLNYINDLNESNFKKYCNGNYLNSKTIEYIKDYHDSFYQCGDFGSNKEEIKYIIKETFRKNYKQLRTFYMFLITDETKSNEIDIVPEEENDFLKQLSEISDIPDYVIERYKKEGMDAIYELYDLDELINSGIKIK